MSRNPLVIDAAIAVVIVAFVLIIEPGVAIAAILALVLLLACGDQLPGRPPAAPAPAPRQPGASPTPPPLISLGRAARPADRTSIWP